MPNKTVTITTLRDFLDCRRAGRFREFWSANKFIDALAFGTAIHAGIEELYKAWPDYTLGKENGQKAILEYFQGEIENLGFAASSSMTDINRCYQLAWDVFNNYVEYDQLDPLVPEGGKILWIERRIITPAIEGVDLSGKIDLAILDAAGRLIIVDHKSSSKPLDQSALDVDEQLTGYCYLAWRESGIVPDRVIYNTIMKVAPQTPTVLQSGKLSVAKEQATTPQLYRQAIIDRNLDPDPKYDEFIQYLESNAWLRYFRREGVRRTKEELIHFSEYMRPKVRDVSLSLSGSWEEAYPAPSIYRCGYCSFVGPCKSMMAGEDWEAVLNSRYKRVS